MIKTTWKGGIEWGPSSHTMWAPVATIARATQTPFMPLFSLARVTCQRAILWGWNFPCWVLAKGEFWGKVWIKSLQPFFSLMGIFFKKKYIFSSPLIEDIFRPQETPIQLNFYKKWNSDLNSPKKTGQIIWGSRKKLIKKTTLKCSLKLCCSLRTHGICSHNLGYVNLSVILADHKGSELFRRVIKLGFQLLCHDIW